MARIPGVDDKDAGLLVGLAYWFTRRKVGKVTEPVRIHALHPRLLTAMGNMEMGLQAAKAVDATLKSLVSIKVAMTIGCPF